MTHEHFCSACYGIGNGVKKGSTRGWWRCNKKPCTRPTQTLCKVHSERLESTGTRRD